VVLRASRPVQAPRHSLEQQERGLVPHPGLAQQQEPVQAVELALAAQHSQLTMGRHAASSKAWCHQSEQAR